MYHLIYTNDKKLEIVKVKNGEKPTYDGLFLNATHTRAGAILLRNSTLRAMNVRTTVLAL